MADRCPICGALSIDGAACEPECDPGQLRARGVTFDAAPPRVVDFDGRDEESTGPSDRALREVATTEEIRHGGTWN